MTLEQHLACVRRRAVHAQKAQAQFYEAIAAAVKAGGSVRLVAEHAGLGKSRVAEISAGSD